MRRALVLVLLAVLGVSGCTAVVPGTAEPGKIEVKGPKGPVPAGLEAFYGQALVWRDCKALGRSAAAKASFGRRGTECAMVEVPLDYAEPGARAISLGVLRVRASGEHGRIGSLVINPGGPGQSGMVAAAMLSSRLSDSPLRQSFDLVGFDPRGVGISEPRITCLTSAEQEAVRQVDASTVELREAQAADFAGKCAERTGTRELANIGTRDVARDMDVLRSALGDDQLTYLGYSYGTRLGTAYAEAFPRNVRAMVLDGAVDPEASLVDGVVLQYKAFDAALDRYLDWCTDQCAVSTRDDLKQLVDDLRQDPVDVGGRRVLPEDVITAIVAALYSEDAWPVLESALDALSAGDATEVMGLSDTYQGRGQDGEYDGASTALTAIRCVDDPPVRDRARLAPVVDQVKGTFLAYAQPPLPSLDACAFWPVPNTSTPHKPNTPGLVTPVVISTTGDPATPYQAGVQLAEDLGGVLVSFQGNQHTAYLQGDPCVDQVGDDYLIQAKVPTTWLTC
ncbi:alpha/beta hydrolase [Actinokineospora bangkokensis]|uniref:Uncharacterized protein n=1 Tax=Actinokineospora bangkokensis TaxID=1193682 RepID=A0A1Q9LDW9_9PSEU|nr:alpha/beta hydrolase [Actinokineospora bangkokensis]OLR90203.1 hypothetical protein BJP25_04395 [Actinokineospora bangkokensis]